MIHYYTNIPMFSERSFSDWNRQLVIKITSDITSMRSIIDYIEAAVESPYVKDNWDGFLEAITDLTWLDRKRIILLHDGLPGLAPNDLKTYLEVIKIASDSWDSFDAISKEAIETYVRQGTDFGEDCWVYKKKTFDVYFREKDREAVEDCVIRYKHVADKI